MIALQGHQLQKSYENVQALKGVDFKVRVGERVALLGSNGAGKSSLIDIFSGQKAPNSGTLDIFEARWDSLEQRRRFSVLPQTLDFPKELRVKDVLRLVAAHYDCPHSADYARRLHITELQHKAMDQLSGGEKRRVAFLLTFIGSPALLILDEPTANIDIETRRLMYAFIEDYFSQPDRTLLFSSHQIDEVQRLADRIVVLHQGVVILDETLAKIQATLASKKVTFQVSVEADKVHLQNLSGTSPIRWQGLVAEVLSRDSDAFVQALVKTEIPFANLRVGGADLEDFILTLWGRQ